MNARSIVKVQWSETDDGWEASLLTSGTERYRSFPLEIGNPVNLEILSSRRCTGFASGHGERTVCPRFAEIESGSQCHRCRNRDIYTGYVEGRGSDTVDGTFDVYLAQCGTTVKVGVTRHGRAMKRWVEQGADYGGIILSDVSQEQALETESSLSDNGVPERIRKQDKIVTPVDSRLKSVAEEHGYTIGTVTPVQEQTIYPTLPEHPFSREGRFVGDVTSVKGQIIATDSQCMAMTSGRVVTRPTQRGLDDF